MSTLLNTISKNLKDKYKSENKLIINTMGDIPLDVLSSGSILVDECSGIGGITAKGHVVEIVGANTSGKTTLCIQSAVEAQKKGWNVVYIDAESVFDRKYALSLGLDVTSDSFVLMQPLNGEEVMGFLEIVHDSISEKSNSGETVDLIIVDSVATVRSTEELMGNKQLGQHAALWSKLSYKIKNLAYKFNIAFILVNQVRFSPKLGGFTAPGVLDSAQNSDMGSENTTGGEALKFLYSIRWQLKGFSKIKEKTKDPLTGKESDTQVGNLVHVTTIKNKLAVPMVKTRMAVLYGRGTVDSYVLEDIMRDRGFITNAGSRLTYEALDPSLTKSILGKANFQEYFRSPGVQEDVIKRFYELVSKGSAKEKVPLSKKPKVKKISIK